MKYKLTEETIEKFRKTLHRIQALRSFGDVKKGELGGYIESEKNLSQEGNCWVSDTARISQNKDIFWISNVGSRYGTTTFFRLKESEILVKCGDFFGTIDVFEKQVQETHGDNTDGQVYDHTIQIAKLQILG